MNSRDLAKILVLSGAVAGLAAGSNLRASTNPRDVALAGIRPANAVSSTSSANRIRLSDDQAKKGDEKPATEKHACKGLNACKGQGNCKSGDNGCAGKNSCKGKGGCASAEAKHSCKGQNACKAQGGCKSGDNGCAGKNSCKGKGGCAVPVEHDLSK